MKNLILLLTILSVTFVSSCESNQTNNKNETSNKSANLASRLKINKWGPEETKIGVIPNKQPDGKMGVWMEVNSTEGLGELQILFGGKPMPTAVEKKGLTAGIPPSELSAAGEKKIEIQSLSNGEIVFVGNFKILP